MAAASTSSYFWHWLLPTITHYLRICLATLPRLWQGMYAGPSSDGDNHPVDQDQRPLRSLDAPLRLPTPIQHRYFPPQRYVAVSAISVYVGHLNVKTVLTPIPMVARVSVVDYRGAVVLDTYVKPTHRIVDYRSAQTGLHPGILSNGSEFAEVQRQVASCIHGKIIVGHRLWSFLSVLGLSHPALHTRDLALFLPLQRKLKCRTIVELSNLVHLFMGRKIGMDYEDSVETSRSCMDLFRSCEEVFERSVSAGSWPCDLPPSSYAEYFT